MRTLEPAHRVRVGWMSVAVTLLVLAVGQSFTSIPMLFATPVYYAQFTDTGGISVGDKVRVAGIDSGKVEGLAIDRNRIVVEFSAGATRIGADSRLAIRTDTLLGKKVLEIEARGTRPLRPGETLPVGQTTTPYQIYDAFFDVSKAASGWDIDTVKQSLHVLSQTVDRTYPHLSAALDGVARFSDTIGKRDEDVRHLLAQADQVAGVLADRSEQIDHLLVHANTLLAAFNDRGQAIDALLKNVAAFSAQVQALIHDNPELTHVLEQLRTVSGILVAHKNDLAQALTAIGKFLPSLNEAVASGPFFKVILSNLVPGQILQPFVDAAFKHRGIDPENFWRSAGLPAYRFPDPNGTRMPNGAPPPAPPVREGTADHPGPAVPPGSPCSYTPPADGLPRPDNPLPCANSTAGPFGGPGFPAPIDVATTPPNPHGLPPTPGLPAAARPGQPPPDVPGTPVPLPAASPGGRTDPAPVAAPPPVPHSPNPGAGPAAGGSTP